MKAQRGLCLLVQSMCRELPAFRLSPTHSCYSFSGSWERRLNVSALPAATPTEWELSLFVEHLGVLLFAGSLLHWALVPSNPFTGMKLCACYEAALPEWVKQGKSSLLSTSAECLALPSSGGFGR